MTPDELLKKWNKSIEMCVKIANDTPKEAMVSQRAAQECLGKVRAECKADTIAMFRTLRETLKEDLVVDGWEWELLEKKGIIPSEETLKEYEK